MPRHPRRKPASAMPGRHETLSSNPALVITFSLQPGPDVRAQRGERVELIHGVEYFDCVD